MADYIKNMRKFVGHAPILMCGASVIVENERGEILLQQRSDNKMWGYAGGAVELDEAVEDAAKRELFEETGITAHSLELFGVFSGKDLHHIYPNGDEVSIVEIIYICNNYSGDLKPQPDEVLDLKFFPINSLPEDISPPIRKGLSAYLDKRLQYKNLKYSQNLSV